MSCPRFPRNPSGYFRLGIDVCDPAEYQTLMSGDLGGGLKRGAKVTSLVARRRGSA